MNIQEKVLTHNHPDLATTFDTIGNIYANLGEFDKALEFYKIAIQKDERNITGFLSIANTYVILDDIKQHSTKMTRMVQAEIFLQNFLNRYVFVTLMLVLISLHAFPKSFDKGKPGGHEADAYSVLPFQRNEKI